MRARQNGTRAIRTTNRATEVTIRHVGILAHSTEGAALCFRTYCSAGADRLGDHVYPDVTLDYIVFGHSMSAWDGGDHATVRSTLSRSLDRLAAAGAEFFVCPDNTAHLALEHGGPPLALPGLHIADVVADAAARAGHRKVGVLGTRYTMNGHVYPTALRRRGIASEIPDAAARELVNRIIFEELVNGELLASSRRSYQTIIDALAEDGCDAVALVCTEIPLLITAADSTLPVLDSTRLAAVEALAVAVGDRDLPTWRGGPPPD